MPASEIDRAEYAARRLKEDTVLAKRPAEAYAYRDIIGVDRQITADELGMSPSHVDNALRNARERIQTAKRTVSITEELEQAEREYGPPGQ